jgi:hypothetical protein
VLGRADVWLFVVLDGGADVPTDGLAAPLLLLLLLLLQRRRGGGGAARDDAFGSLATLCEDHKLLEGDHKLLEGDHKSQNICDFVICDPTEFETLR